MKSSPKPPPGNDPLYCEFVAEYVKASEADKNTYLLEILGEQMKKYTNRVIVGSIIAVVVAFLVVGATGGSPLEIGIGILLGILIGALITTALYKR